MYPKARAGQQSIRRPHMHRRRATRPTRLSEFTGVSLVHLFGRPEWNLEVQGFVEMRADHKLRVDTNNQLSPCRERSPTCAHVHNHQYDPLFWGESRPVSRPYPCLICQRL